MRRLDSKIISNFIGKDIRLVYVNQAGAQLQNNVIVLDHKITQNVKLLRYIPPASAEIQRSNGVIEIIDFTEAWDPNAVKPMISN